VAHLRRHAAILVPDVPGLEPASHATTLTGYTDVMTGVAFSPDGTPLAIASADPTVRTWDPVSGDCLATLLRFRDGSHAVLLRGGSYKLDGDPQCALWWAIRLCRFEPGELGPYVSDIRWLPEGSRIR
jgi:WD40 repeat protein